MAKTPQQETAKRIIQSKGQPGALVWPFVGLDVQDGKPLSERIHVRLQSNDIRVEGQVVGQQIIGLIHWTERDIEPNRTTLTADGKTYTVTGVKQEPVGTQAALQKVTLV